jgi:hypothetical protein
MTVKVTSVYHFYCKWIFVVGKLVTNNKMQVAVDTESGYCLLMFWNEVFAHSTMCVKTQARNNVTYSNKV